jgi:hypothetical protein
VARNKSPKGGGQEEAAEKKTKWNVRFYFSKIIFLMMHILKFK